MAEMTFLGRVMSLRFFYNLIFNFLGGVIMKKFVLLLAVILCSGAAMQAQIHFGAKVGANLSNYVGENAPHRVNVNYHVGGFVEFGVLGILSVAPEVMFSSQGGSRQIANYAVGDMVMGKATEKWRTSYVNVPIMLKLNLLNKFSLDVGPQFGFNVSSKAKIDTNHLESSYDDRSDFTKTFDLALALGATYNVNRFIFLQGRYVMSVTKSYRSDVFGISLPINARNGVLQLSVGLKL